MMKMHVHIVLGAYLASMMVLVGCGTDEEVCGQENPQGKCPSGQACQFGACVDLVGSASVTGFGKNLGAMAYKTTFSGGSSRFSVTILKGAACHSLPKTESDVLHFQFNPDFPVGEEIGLQGEHFLMSSYRAADSTSNELATELTLVLSQFDTLPEGVIVGTFTASFPSADLEGYFSAFLCSPL